MIHYRTFRNSDPPALVQIWRARAVERGLTQPISTQVLEELVFSKPYFDNQGLILAIDDKTPVGFVHAGFGATDDEKHISHLFGATCMLMVRHDYRRLGIGRELITRSEQYLRDQGAKVLYGGGIRPLNPFYLGLYGGSELPGVLDSDQAAQQIYRACGYREIDRTCIFQRDLAGFRPPVDRQQMKIRRSMTVEVSEDPPTSTWWEACTFGGFERTRFQLIEKSSRRVMASAIFWRIEPLGTSWGVQVAGLIDLEVKEGHRKQGIATALVSEALKHLGQAGFHRVEVQTMQANTAALHLYEKIGFQEVDGGAVFRKDNDG